jgi:DNA mismatch repair ATPase MutS
MDRDFDPKQILSQREKQVRPSNTDDRLNLQQLLPWNEKALIQDLGLDILINAMARRDNFLFEVGKVSLLCSIIDIDTIHYRQEILNDCLKQEQIVRDLYKITIEAIEQEKDIFWSFFSRNPSGILSEAVRTLQRFVVILQKLRNIADQNCETFESDGFKRLFEMLRQELSDDYFVKIDEHLKQLKFDDGVLISAKLGPGNKGSNYVLHKTLVDKRRWIARLLSKKTPGYTYQIHPRDEAGARALSELRDQSVNLVANALAQSTDHILSFFQALRTELAFYIGCLNLHENLSKIQEPICFPVAFPSGNRKLSISGLYDTSLSLSAGRKIISNELNADGKNLIIITGANTGGKSTFMRSIGLAQMMMQAGMFVSAETFSAEISDGIVTHFKREEDTAMESGKLDEELRRMSDIVDKINSKFMVLFNESFAATNEREGSEIAKQITNSLVDKGIKVVFVTHNFEFANGLYEKKMKNTSFLRAERQSDGTRTFKVVEGEPLQTSYGKDLYDKIFHKLVEPVKPNNGLMSEE